MPLNTYIVTYSILNHQNAPLWNHYIPDIRALYSEMLPASTVSDNRQITSQIIGFPAVCILKLSGGNESSLLCQL